MWQCVRGFTECGDKPVRSRAGRVSEGESALVENKKHTGVQITSIAPLIVVTSLEMTNVSQLEKKTAFLACRR